MDEVARARLGAISRVRAAARAPGLEVGPVEPGAFGVQAADEASGGGELGFKSVDFCGVYVGEGAVGAEVFGGAWDPQEAASGVEHEGNGLRRGSKGERNRVSSIAAWEKSSLFSLV